MEVGWVGVERNDSFGPSSSISSIIYEVIRPVLIFFMMGFYTHKKHKKNTRHQKYQKTVLKLLFIFFHDKILHTQKSLKEYKAPKGTKSTKSTKTQPNKSIKTQISEQKLKMRLKTSKGKKVAYLGKKVSRIEILTQLN